MQQEAETKAQMTAEAEAVAGAAATAEADLLHTSSQPTALLCQIITLHLWIIIITMDQALFDFERRNVRNVRELMS